MRTENQEVNPHGVTIVTRSHSLTATYPVDEVILSVSATLKVASVNRRGPSAHESNLIALGYHAPEIERWGWIDIIPNERPIDRYETRALFVDYVQTLPFSWAAFLRRELSRMRDLGIDPYNHAAATRWFNTHGSHWTLPVTEWSRIAPFLPVEQRHGYISNLIHQFPERETLTLHLGRADIVVAAALGAIDPHGQIAPERLYS